MDSFVVIDFYCYVYLNDDNHENNLCSVSSLYPLSHIFAWIILSYVHAVLRFFCYLVTFNIDDEAAFVYSLCFGEIYLILGSAFLKNDGRFTLRWAGDTAGCDNYLISNFSNLLRYWLRNLLLGNLLKYGSWVSRLDWPLSVGENEGLKISCRLSRTGVGNMSDN